MEDRGVRRTRDGRPVYDCRRGRPIVVGIQTYIFWIGQIKSLFDNNFDSRAIRPAQGLPVTQLSECVTVMVDSGSEAPGHHQSERR